MSLAAPRRWSVPGWDRFPGLRHGFFGRAGGGSVGDFASLNCSARVGDDDAAVGENRARVEAALGLERIALPAQVHGDRIEVVTSLAPGEADGLVIGGEDGVGAGILTADCVPLLLVDPERRLAVAIHAGWKGTALGIAARAVEQLTALSAAPVSRLHAALGPAIGACCYEVGNEVVEAIEAGAGFGLVHPRRHGGGKSWIDLRAINAALLERCGVPAAQVQSIGPCTRCAMDECFSHRGSGGTAGRQLSAIGFCRLST